MIFFRQSDKDAFNEGLLFWGQADKDAFNEGLFFRQAFNEGLLLFGQTVLMKDCLFSVRQGRF